MYEITQLPKNWTIANLEDLLVYNQPTHYIVESTDYDENYRTPVLTAGKTFVLGRTNESRGVFTDLPVIIFDDFTTASKYVNFPFKVKSSAMKILKPATSEVDVTFVFYYMQTIRITIDTHKRYWISLYSKINTPLPPLAEQKRIVARIEELFSSLDAGVASLKKAQAQLKTYRQSVLKWAFEGRLTNPDVKDGELPSGWKWVKLENLLNCIEAGKSFKCDERPPSANETGILKVSAVSWGYFNEAESKTITDVSKINHKYVVRKGDFLFSRANTLELIGAVVKVNEISKTLLLSDKTLRLLFNAELVFDDYVLYFLRSISGRKQIQKLSSGNQASMRNIGQEGIRQIELPLSDSICKQKDVVTEIESRLSVCDKLEESIALSLEQAGALRQSILKKAFEGRLVPQDPNDEPASVLLERIRAEREKAATLVKTKTTTRRKKTTRGKDHE